MSRAAGDSTKSGVRQLVGLLSRGDEAVAHPAAATVLALLRPTEPDDAREREQCAAAWAKEFLAGGVLPPLLLLRDT